MPEVTALKAWLGTWSGLGHIVVGMERQGYALSLRKIHDNGWAATFHRHPLPAPEGFSTAAAPFVAVQQAALGGLSITRRCRGGWTRTRRGGSVAAAIKVVSSHCDRSGESFPHTAYATRSCRMSSGSSGTYR